MASERGVVYAAPGLATLHLDAEAQHAYVYSGTRAQSAPLFHAVRCIMARLSCLKSARDDLQNHSPTKRPNRDGAIIIPTSHGTTLPRSPSLRSVQQLLRAA